MALELVFVCPGTLGKLRSDPLGKLLDGYCDWLLECGFKTATVRKHLANAAHFNAYLATQKGKGWRTVSAEDINGFYNEYYPSRARSRKLLANHVRCVRWSINRFIRYPRRLNLFDPLVKPATYQPLLDAYHTWMCDYQYAASSTLEIRSPSLRQFLQWLGPQATVEGLSELTPKTVERFFLSYAQKMGRSARRSMQSALRTFFRFCLHQGYVLRPLDGAVPTLRTYKLATVGVPEFRGQYI
ncbi:MAG: hypothetical protein L3J79_04985 [Candidatus Marinimicrobia bacterium]|nr:hypothetical protein [Candidatus Neomarinimicrobiota bacterium]